MNVLKTILDSGVVAIIRSDSSSGLLQAGEALAQGGVRVMEITLTTPGALKAIAEIAALPERAFVIGAGSVLDANDAQAAMDAGAEFLVTPNVDTEVIRLAKAAGVPVCAGALTPSEIVTASKAGADVIKVFPASQLGGPAYIKALKGPLPGIRMMAVGGVGVHNTEEYIKAGCCGVGIGGSLVNAALIRESRWEQMTQVAAQCIEAVQRGRE